jgi:hypothetical protein
MPTISVYTPTHRPDHLLEAYESLHRQQGEVDWEWVLVPNGPAAQVPDSIGADSRVVIAPFVGELCPRLLCPRSAG